MNLSSELLSQWAKVINKNDNKKTKTETTVYGTTVEQDGIMYVRLDGSDLLTPTTSTTDTKSGERVMVLIKNHTATITGNISSPSARTADVQDVASTAEDTAGKVTTTEEELKNVKVTLTNHTNSIKTISKSIEDLSVDYIIECGSDDIWTFEKWASGKAICWCRYSASNVNAAKNNLDDCYYSSTINVTFPFTFAKTPVISVNGGDVSHMHYIREFGSTKTKASFIVVCNSSDQTSVDVEVSIYVIGTYDE